MTDGDRERITRHFQTQLTTVTGGFPGGHRRKLTRPQGFGSVVPMTRFVVDCGAVLHLASEGLEVPEEHELLAPTLLRSQTLSALQATIEALQTA